MKVLWLCNIVLPELSETFGFKKIYGGGWLTGAWTEIKKQNSVELGICVPIRNPKRVLDGTFEGYKYYSFLTISAESNTDICSQVDRFKEIIEDFKPNVIHIWGTEFEHSYAMVKACEQIGISDKVLVNIQGLLTYCEKVYEYGIPEEIAIQEENGYSIRVGQNSFYERSKLEQSMLKGVKHVSGRTEWDRDGVLNINPDVHYHKCGEILREQFYFVDKWNVDKYKEHSVFVSQVSYPLKGFHLVLHEIKTLSLKYPDLTVKVAGQDLSKSEGTYAKYIRDIIRELKLESVIFFLGNLNASQMIEEYQKANVFLSPSVIENSSNSVCEAMMIGTPVVASCVGGIPSLIKHGYNGFMYPLTEPEQMRFFIENIFDKKVNLWELSLAEIEFAENFNNVDNCISSITRMYSEISDI